MKMYYAGMNYYGIGVVFAKEQGWSFFAFPTKKERDEWVEENEMRNGNVVACPAYYTDIRKVLGADFQVDDESHELYSRPSYR